MHQGTLPPKGLDPVVLVTPLPTKPEDFPQPVDTSFQVSTPDNAKMEDASLEEIPAAFSPTAEAPGSSSDATNLWGEANKALGELLVIKSSIDARWQKLHSTPPITKLPLTKNLAIMKENLCTKYTYSSINTSALMKSHL